MNRRTGHTPLSMLGAATAVPAQAGTSAGVPDSVWILAIVFILLALFGGYRLGRRRTKRLQRRRLGMFPERSPNPVLALTETGTVRYANPATTELLRRIGLDPTQGPDVLLPADLDARLAALRATPEHSATWEYAVAGHTLECTALWIRDLALAHVYLSDITERKEAEAELVYQAYHDALTHLPNRRLFEEQAGHVMYDPGRTDVRAALLLLGLDRFKIVIDSLGHAVGDELLVAVAQRLEETLRDTHDLCPNCMLYRFEGDLFGVCLPEFGTGEIPILMAERLNERLRAPFYAAGRELHVTASIGIAIYPLDGQDADTLLKNAGTAMHRAKAAGGDSLQCYTRDMNDRAAEWLALEGHLRHAEEYGELELYYQPQADVASGEIKGMEALVRWRHPQRGLLSPAVFVPLAEETGLVASIGTWILRTACARTKAWPSPWLPAGIPGCRSAIRCG